MKTNRNPLISLHHGSPSENRTYGQFIGNQWTPIGLKGGPFAILRLTILVRLGGRRRDLSQPNPDVWGILDRMAFFGALLASPFPCSLGLATQKRTSPV